jgi:hypothetical protein
MICQSPLSNQILVILSVIFGAIALTLASIGIGTSNWQVTTLTKTTGETIAVSAANFFYACRYDIAGEIINCADRDNNNNDNIAGYFAIIGIGNQSNYNFHLNIAAGFSILGIVFIFFGTIATIFMFIGDRAEWIFPVAPSLFFVACLAMLTGLAEGSRVLLYNGYSANLYETAHVLTIFSFLISSLVGGRLFDHPHKPKTSKRVK